MLTVQKLDDRLQKFIISRLFSAGTLNGSKFCMSLCLPGK
jgi:hypothetical protein